jgi:DNA invertase Pin-like site-specific DNA recombinase
MQITSSRVGRRNAQYAAVVAFLRQHGGTIVAQYVEVESGNRSDRPELAKVWKRGRKDMATLLIAKLDRLARDPAFIAYLMAAGVNFVACDQPFTNRLTLHTMAAVARAARTRYVAKFNATTRAVIAQIQGSGVSTLVEIGKAFEARGMRTPRGHTTWWPVQVWRLLAAEGRGRAKNAEARAR